MTTNFVLWRLSGGITIFGMAGMFWLGWGLGQTTLKAGWVAWSTFLAVWIISGAAIIAAGIRLRRRSGFKYSDLRQGDARQQAETRRMLRGWVWITIAQTVAVGLGVLCCVRTNRFDLVGPVVGLVVSLHFAPLARIFHVRQYYVTALAGSGVSLAALIRPTAAHAHELFCGAMALVMWASAVYAIRNSNQIAQQAAQETWTA
jgi:hypothetical protein